MRKEIKIKKKSNNYVTLVDTGKWLLVGRFDQKKNGQVNFIDLILMNRRGQYKIQDVYFCNSSDITRLEIHIFEGNEDFSRFVANRSHLNQMKLNKNDKINFDFIDYSEDQNPQIEHCFKPDTSSTLQPEVNDGNILVGE